MNKNTILNLIEKSSSISTEDLYLKCYNLKIISALISYLKENSDDEMQALLDDQLNNLEMKRSYSHGNIFFNYNENCENLPIIYSVFFSPKSSVYISDLYRKGVTSNDNKRIIVKKNINRADYYRYLSNRVIWQYRVVYGTLIREYDDSNKGLYKKVWGQLYKKHILLLEDIRKKWQLTKEQEEKIKKDYEKNRDLIDYRYTKYLLSKYRPKLKDGIINLKKEIALTNEMNTPKADNISDFLRLAVSYFNVNKIYNQENIMHLHEAKQRIIEKKKKNIPIEKREKELFEYVSSCGTSLKDYRIERTKKSCSFVCSDLHGNYNAYKRIIDEIRNDDKLYILGDVIDRGPDGIRILQDIIKRENKKQIKFILGNHEYMMIKALLDNDKDAYDLWMYNGGKPTLDAYKKLSEDKQNEIKEFLLNSDVYKEIKVGKERIHLVHARAMQNSKKNSETLKELISQHKQSEVNSMLWDREGEDCERNEIAKESVITIIGHTPTEKGQVEYRAGFIKVDCGIMMKNNVALVNMDYGTVQYFSSYELEKNNKEHLRDEK